MIYYLLGAALWLLLPILKVWPPVFRDKERTCNTMLLITMRPQEHFDRQGYSYQACLGQETVEWWLKWAVALPLAIPIIALVDHPIAYASPVLTYIWSLPFKKQLEWIGHASEVLIAKSIGWDEEDYLAYKAGWMPGAYEGMFEGDDIKGGIRKRYGIARVLIAILGLGK